MITSNPGWGKNCILEMILKWVEWWGGGCEEDGGLLPGALFSRANFRKLRLEIHYCFDYQHGLKACLTTSMTESLFGYQHDSNLHKVR